jgi:hypothetical protein
MTTNDMNPFDSNTWGQSEQDSATQTEPTSVDSQEKTQDNGATQPEPQGGNEPSPSNDNANDAASATTSTTEDEDKDEFVQPELTFKNDVSKKVFDAILSGNYNDIAPIIYEQTKLSNLEKLDTNDLIKMQMKYENPDMSEADINKEFSDRYEFEEEKVDTSFMTEEEIASHNRSVEKSKKKLDKEMKRDARDAIRFLSEKKQEIDIPNINDYIKSSSTAIPDNSKEVAEYNQYMESERKKYEDSIEPSLEKITAFEMDYKDDEVNFKVNFLPNKEDMASMKDKLKSFTLEDYFGPKYYNQEKGEYNTAKLADDIYWMENREKIVKSIVSQAVSSAKVDMLRKIKGVSINDSPHSNTSTTSASTKSEMDAFVDKLYSM